LYYRKYCSKKIRPLAALKETPRFKLLVSVILGKIFEARENKLIESLRKVLTAAVV
jgi:hypothetical protein